MLGERESLIFFVANCLLSSESQNTLQFSAGTFSQSISYYTPSNITFIKGNFGNSLDTIFNAAAASTSNAFFYFTSSSSGSQVVLSDLVLFFTYRFGYMSGNNSKLNLTNIQIKTNTSSFFFFF
jgi:hypothetical protein